MELRLKAAKNAPYASLTLSGGVVGRTDADDDDDENGDELYSSATDDKNNSNNNNNNVRHSSYERRPASSYSQVTLSVDKQTCPGCGTSFQCKSPSKVGYITPLLFQRVKDAEQRQGDAAAPNSSSAAGPSPGQRLLDSLPDAMVRPGSSPSDPVSSSSDSSSDSFDISNLPTLKELKKALKEADGLKNVVCERCHKLQYGGVVDESLRPGGRVVAAAAAAAAAGQPVVARQQKQQPSQVGDDSEPDDSPIDPSMDPQTFIDLLLPLSNKNVVILALIDLFDFNSGSILTNLDKIAGPKNTVILAANKVDLLPAGVGLSRVENWVRAELQHVGVSCVGRTRRQNADSKRDYVTGDVRCVSAKTGFGVRELMTKVRAVAMEEDADVYIVGGGNAGKSTLVNRLLKEGGVRAVKYVGQDLGSSKHKKNRKGDNASFKGLVTTSPLPGTTLNFIKMKLGDKEGRRYLYDTPGILDVRGTITGRLTPAELRLVLPRKKVTPVTFRVCGGRSVLVGGLARVDVLGDEDRAFLLTFFVSEDIKLQPCRTEKADEILRRHVGKMLTPPCVEGQAAERKEKENDEDDDEDDSDDDPFAALSETPFEPTEAELKGLSSAAAATMSDADSPYDEDDEDDDDPYDNALGLSRLSSLGPFASHTFSVSGLGWKESCGDITLKGLGWVSVCGSGTATVVVSLPKGVGVELRPPLMPFEAWRYIGKFTGSKVNQRGKR